MRGSTNAVILTLVLLGVSACTGENSTVDPTDSTSASPMPTLCADATAGQPPQIFGLTFDQVSAATFATTLTVPFAGLTAGSLDRPSVVQVSVRASTANAPVTFTAPGAHFIERLDDPWSQAPDQVTVFTVAGGDGCVASVFLLGTTAGQVTVTARGKNSESADVTVVTSPAAARNVEVRTEVERVRAGKPVTAIVAVTDAFNNPVAGVAVILTTPEDGPGRFFNGTRRAVLLTDDSGTAAAEFATVPGEGSRLNITARGDQPACDPLINQYECAAGEPVASFAAPIGRATTSVGVRQPRVRVESPVPSTQFSAEQPFSLTANTAGVASGTLAQVLWGDEVLALGSVDENGSLRVVDIRARITSASKNYQLVVGSLPRKKIDITVLPFAVTEAKRQGQDLLLTIAPGAWPVGTTLIILRDGKRVTTSTVRAVGTQISVSVPSRSGFYNVRVRDSGTVVQGADPLLIN